MGDGTKIQWTDATWSPVTGCERVSPGCDNCYAERQTATRLRNVPAYAGLTDEKGRWTGKVRLHPDRLDQPGRWRRPRRIFVCSMSDLFHPDVPVGFIEDVFGAMAAAPQHTFQVLTKRPQRMALILQSNRWEPSPNVWVGTSIESQTYAYRARYLAGTPAAVRFVSAEPLLGPLDLTPHLHHPDLGPFGVDWVIVGGESGPGARRMAPGWMAELRDQCREAGVAFFAKQAGTVLGAEWGCVDSHGGDWEHWPEELRVREWPR